jgi:hypothetical protein
MLRHGCQCAAEIIECALFGTCPMPCSSVSKLHWLVVILRRYNIFYVSCAIRKCLSTVFLGSSLPFMGIGALGVQRSVSDHSRPSQFMTGGAHHDRHDVLSPIAVCAAGFTHATVVAAACLGQPIWRVCKALLRPNSRALWTTALPEHVIPEQQCRDRIAEELRGVPLVGVLARICLCCSSATLPKLRIALTCPCHTSSKTGMQPFAFVVSLNARQRPSTFALLYSTVQCSTLQCSGQACAHP